MALSLGVHALVLVPTVLDGITVPVEPAEPGEQATIELVPEEIVGQMAETAPTGEAAESETTQADPVETPSARESPRASSLASAPIDETATLALNLPAMPAPPTARPSAPAASPGRISVNLAGTDSASNALVAGPSVIPVSPEDSKRNRPPVYPPDAARRGQTGRVVVVIEVTPMGLAKRANIVTGSGVDSLDRSAIDAVMAWRFRPAVRDGRAIASEMVMEFIFTGREN